mgnify:CR=1 FL=1
MTVLTFDTSTAVLSLSLLDEAPRARALHMVRDEGLHHAERLAGDARDILAAAGLTAADLDLVGCAAGPGSFTGLRIGMATAKGFAAARGVPFVAVPTLDIWAELYAYMPGLVVPVIDARKRQFYAAVYRGGTRLTADLDATPEEVMVHVSRLAVSDSEEPLFVGPDAPAFVTTAPRTEPEAAPSEGPPGWGLRVAPAADVVPSHALARLALRRYRSEGAAASGAAPVYVRRSDAELGGSL